DVDFAAHELHQLARDPQPEPEAAVVALRRRALELVEDALLLLGSDADAVIDDAHFGALAVAADRDLDRLTLPILDGVGDEVGQDLVEARATPHPRQRRRRLQRERHALPAGLFAQARHHVARDLDEIDALDLQLEPAHADARDVEERVDELLEP